MSVDIIKVRASLSAVESVFETPAHLVDLTPRCKAGVERSTYDTFGKKGGQKKLNLNRSMKRANDKWQWIHLKRLRGRNLPKVTRRIYSLIYDIRHREGRVKHSKTEVFLVRRHRNRKGGYFFDLRYAISDDNVERWPMPDS